MAFCVTLYLMSTMECNPGGTAFSSGSKFRIKLKSYINVIEAR